MEPATQYSSLLSLDTEILATIAKHLKPQHLYKLMQTCRSVKNAVDNEQYWERLALHVIFRHHAKMETENINYGEKRIFPQLKGLHNLLNLEHGYCKTLDIIESRVRYLMLTDEVEEDNWKVLESAPITQLVWAGEARITKPFIPNPNFDSDDMTTFDPHENCINPDIVNHYRDTPVSTMKDVVRREFMYKRDDSIPNGNRFLRKFENAIDDDNSISREIKAKFMKTLERLMRDLFCEVGDQRRVNFADVADIARRFDDH